METTDYGKDRLTHQQHILAKYGTEAVDKAHHQLCLVCKLYDIHYSICLKLLIPLTLEGKPCPYFLA